MCGHFPSTGDVGVCTGIYCKGRTWTYGIPIWVNQVICCYKTSPISIWNDRLIKLSRKHSLCVNEIAKEFSLHSYHTSIRIRNLGRKYQIDEPEEHYLTLREGQFSEGTVQTIPSCSAGRRVPGAQMMCRLTWSRVRLSASSEGMGRWSRRCSKILSRISLLSPKGKHITDDEEGMTDRINLKSEITLSVYNGKYIII